MPTYEFSCPACGGFRDVFPMADVPAETMCPGCGAGSRRLLSSPFVARLGSPALNAVEAAARTAAEPGIVHAPPAPRRAPRVTRNPLHAKLPRP